MSELVELPSGLSGQIRGLSTGEMKVLRNRGLIRSGKVTDEVLRLCWMETVSPGPYGPIIGKNGHPDWQRVLVGDRSVASLHAAVLTFGRTRPFEFSCPRSGCEATAWNLDLLTEVRIKGLEPQDLERFIAGNRFEGTLPDGKAFAYRMALGADSAKFAHLTALEVEEALVPIITSRIISIEGVQPNMLKNYVEGIGPMDTFRIMTEMSLVDCGLDDEVQVQCETCARKLSVPFPLEKLWSVDLKGMKEQMISERKASSSGTETTT